jgi:hypothetical protein
MTKEQEGLRHSPETSSSRIPLRSAICFCPKMRDSFFPLNGTDYVLLFHLTRNGVGLIDILDRPVPTLQTRSILARSDRGFSVNSNGVSSAYAGDHGLGRGEMRSSGWRLSDVSFPCFGGFRCRADDPTKPWLFRTESYQRSLA